MKLTQMFSSPAKDKQVLLSLLLVWSLVIAAKLWYRQADADALWFLLAPTAQGLGLLLGVPFALEPGLGYSSAEAGILISQECAGANFLLIATLAGFFALLPRRGHSLWLVPQSLLMAYGLTLLANIARICCLLLAGSFLEVPHWLHLALGAAVYISLLIPYSLLLSHPTICYPYATNTN